MRRSMFWAVAAIPALTIVTACTPPGPTDAEIAQAVREASEASQADGDGLSTDFDSADDHRVGVDSAHDEYERDNERRRREEATMADIRPSLASDPKPTTDLSRYDRR